MLPDDVGAPGASRRTPEAKESSKSGEGGYSGGHCGDGDSCRGRRARRDGHGRVGKAAAGCIGQSAAAQHNITRETVQACDLHSGAKCATLIHCSRCRGNSEREIRRWPGGRNVCDYYLHRAGLTRRIVAVAAERGGDGVDASWQGSLPSCCTVRLNRPGRGGVIRSTVGSREYDGAGRQHSLFLMIFPCLRDSRMTRTSSQVRPFAATLCFRCGRRPSLSFFVST